MRKPDSGKAVLRVSGAVNKFLAEKRQGSESIDRLLRRLLGIPNRKGIIEAKVFWALPTELYSEKAEARGAAVVRKVQTGEAPGKPVAVLVI